MHHMGMTVLTHHMDMAVLTGNLAEEDCLEHLSTKHLYNRGSSVRACENKQCDSM